MGWDGKRAVERNGEGKREREGDREQHERMGMGMEIRMGKGMGFGMLWLDLSITCAEIYSVPHPIPSARLHRGRNAAGNTRP